VDAPSADIHPSTNRSVARDDAPLERADPPSLTVDQQSEIVRLLGEGQAVKIGPDGSVSPVDEPNGSAPGPSQRTGDALGPVAPTPAQERESEFGDVPDGYHNVAWLRPHEAEAALTAYRQLTDAEIRHGGRVTGMARYHADSTQLARKFRANVLIERHSAKHTRIVCWVRRYEAEAVLEAARLGSTVPIHGPGGEDLGRVEYHRPDSELAVRFRSVTRLLRRRGGSRTRPVDMARPGGPAPPSSQ
jgi:hypothetical protein